MDIISRPANLSGGIVFLCMSAETNSANYGNDARRELNGTKSGVS
jgi:hypothetical protein